jgi:8-oxo-dGTP diphosphatase
MERPRACAAIIKDDKILMVCHQTPTRTYWTFPGGGVHAGETFEQAAIREVKEETSLDVEVAKLLFVEDYEYGKSYCYLAKLLGNTEPVLGFDPEETELFEFDKMLQSVEWHQIKDKKDDVQVAKVIQLLGLKYD